MNDLNRSNSIFIEPADSTKLLQATLLYTITPITHIIYRSLDSGIECQLTNC